MGQKKPVEAVMMWLVPTRAITKFVPFSSAVLQEQEGRRFRSLHSTQLFLATALGVYS